ncbi:hypothetical protein CsSME_00044462 [Camellia sinensis var. sinensis]
MRRFNFAWFKEYKNWPDLGKGCDTFVTEGFKIWNMKNKLQIHVGGVNSAHNQAVKKCEDLMKKKQHIQSVFLKQTNQEKIEYRTRLNATVDYIRFLLRRGLAFRGHDESDDSSDKGNFLELLQFLADHNESINRVVLGNTPKNNKLTHHDIQKDIVNAAACETINAIIKDLDNEFFSILDDESRDILVKEQMAVVLRYVDKKGIVIERFLGIVHVSNTTALSLKAAIESLFCRHGLSISKLRGQGYDGASNMQGEFNGLKALILRENKSAFYVHCFAHQLQLTLVAVAKKHIDVVELFCSVIVNVVGGSCKRRDALRDAQFAKITEALDNETSLKRAGDTRWGSHFGTIINLILMFSSSIDVLEIIEEDGLQPEQRVEAPLQKKNQDIVNAMTLVKASKQRLQMMRDDEWESLLTEVSSFFLDMQLQELNNRFSEANTELLLCMACLNPSKSFFAFDKNKLIRLVEFYPYDFSATDLMVLDIQLQNYIVDMRLSEDFLELKGVGDLAIKLVETDKHVIYPLVYLLVKLALTLPVVTATVERSFSAMKYIKSNLRNRMGDQWMNDCLVTYIERDVFDSIDNEEIMQPFQNMKSRRGQL